MRVFQKTSGRPLPDTRLLRWTVTMTGAAVSRFWRILLLVHIEEAGKCAAEIVWYTLVHIPNPKKKPKNIDFSTFSSHFIQAGSGT